MSDDLKNVFDKIAPGWYNFRHRSIFSRELAILARRWQNGKLLNLGCAHGPDFFPFKDNFKLFGVDFSPEMLKLARRYAQKYGFDVELTLGDVIRLPYSDDTFDWAISVATYHHIKGEHDRQSALNELNRVLKPGGEAFITVWNRWQRRFWFKPREIYVPWHQKEQTLQRYYYLFSYGELERLAKVAGFEVLESSPESSYGFPIKAFSRNICLLVKKTR